MGSFEMHNYMSMYYLTSDSLANMGKIGTSSNRIISMTFPKGVRLVTDGKKCRVQMQTGYYDANNPDLKGKALVGGDVGEYPWVNPYTFDFSAISDKELWMNSGPE